MLNFTTQFCLMNEWKKIKQFMFYLYEGVLKINPNESQIAQSIVKNIKDE